MSNENRWIAYRTVGKMYLPEMEKDYLLNCIVYDSEDRIRGSVSSRIISMAKSRLARTKYDRYNALQGHYGILACSLV